MKLGTLKSKNSRDGELVVVDQQHRLQLKATDIAPNLQAALDDWATIEPRLRDIEKTLSQGEPLEWDQFHSPLPRAYQWADGSAYVNHVELVRKARGAEMPESFWTDPLMYQGGSDSFLAPTEDIVMADEAWGVDFEAEVAVIVDDVPMGVSPQDAASHIKLIMLVNDVSLRNLIPAELAKGFGFFQSKPSSAFSPVAVTPDELGEAWDGRRLHLPLIARLNGEQIGAPEAGDDMVFDFPTLIAHAAKTRALAAGSIIGSSTVSNVDRSRGSCCLAEVRMLEIIESGAARTPFMKFGDVIEIEMLDRAGNDIFGTIRQTLVKG